MGLRYRMLTSAGVPPTTVVTTTATQTVLTDVAGVESVTAEPERWGSSAVLLFAHTPVYGVGDSRRLRRPLSRSPR